MEDGLMGRRLLACIGMCLVAILSQVAAFAEGERPWVISLDVMNSFNDNRDGVSANREPNLDTRMVPRADLKLYRDQFDLDFHYSPQICLRSNPREDSQNSAYLYHDLGLEIVHRWSERLMVNLSDTVNYSDQPVDTTSGRSVHEFVNYWVNDFGLGASYEILPKRSAISVRGSHMAKRYNDKPYSAVGDEEAIGCAVSARYMFRSGLILMGDVAYNTTELGDSSSPVARDADVFFVGAALERVFGLLSARLRLGVDQSRFDIAGDYEQVQIQQWTGNTTKPGGDLEVAYSTGSGMTRLALAAAYHTVRSDIMPFATQQRTSFELKASHSFTERIALAVNAMYGNGEYSDLTQVQGGSDALAGVGTTLSYTWNRNLRLETTYRFEDWNSDDNIRGSYRRNIGELALKATF
ncbi:MAG: outer membrane beta-barrel protein [bacterium]